MIVPKYIKNSIRKCGRHSKIAYKHSNIIRDWLCKKNIDHDINTTISQEIITNLVDAVEHGAEDNSFDFILLLEEIILEEE